MAAELQQTAMVQRPTQICSLNFWPGVSVPQWLGLAPWLAPLKATAGGLGGGELGGKPWPLGDPHGLTPGQKLSEQIYVGR